MVDLGDLIKDIWEPQIRADYGMSMNEMAAYVEAHKGEMPPVVNSPFGDIPACWPHFHCTHP